MAHSVRAVEQFLRDTYRFDTQVVLVHDPNVFWDMGRMSWCSVAQNNGDLTYISVDARQDWDHNRRRYCIAHELYHVIWSVGSASKVERTTRVESFCDLFANDLCSKHDSFYAKKENIDKLRFQGLPYRSV